MYSECELKTRKSSALPLQPWFPTSAGLTPVAGRKRPQLQLRYSYPRRADARRSCEPAFVHRKNRFFAGKRSHRTKSGGRKPPVGNKTPPALQIATAYLRRMRLRWLPLLLLGPVLQIRNRFSATTCVRATRSGWREPAVVSQTRFSAATSLCRAEATRKPSVPNTVATATTPAGSPARRRQSPATLRQAFLQARFPNTHGGLTPAALVNVRSCIAKIVFSPTNVRNCNTRAGGVSPPWDVLGMRTRNAEIQRVAVATWFPTSGRLTPVSERKRPQLQLRYSHPRRAHARRSWLCIRQSPNITRLSPDGALIPVPQRADEGRSWFGRCCGELPGLRPVWS
jgi:hypothetical protein